MTSFKQYEKCNITLAAIFCGFLFGFAATAGAVRSASLPTVDSAIAYATPGNDSGTKGSGSAG